MALIAREIITLPISGARMITVFSPNAKKKKKKKRTFIHTLDYIKTLSQNE